MGPDIETETPLTVVVAPGNTNDRKFFDLLYDKVRNIAVLQHL